MGMLVNMKTLEWEEQSIRPDNENWLGDDWLCVPESMKESVKENAPYCVLEIEAGALVGITPTERPPVIPEPTTEDRVKTLESQLKASIQSNALLEECLIEMAGVVYA